MDHIEKHGEEPIQWEIRRIVAHQGPMAKHHPDFIGSTYNVTVEWENGEQTMEPLAIIAAGAPLVCAIYAKEKGLLATPSWKRFRNVAKEYNRCFRDINKANLKNFLKPRLKYGIEIPRNYKHAIELDQRNGNTKWQDAVALKMQHMSGYNLFEDKDIDATMPEGYKKIRVHLVYDVKHDGRHRARLVAGGHLTNVPDDSTYSGVESLCGFRMLVFLAELNGLETWATDIASAYLEAHTAEKVYIITGPEFGPLEGHTLCIVRALYRLRTSGQRWHDQIAACLRQEGFIPCCAEPDIWLPANKVLYEYVVV